MHTFVSKLRFVLTLIVASMMILAGCGGGNSTPTNSTAPPPVLQVVTFTLIPARVVRSALCEDEITGLGGCVGIDQQADIPRIIAQNQQAPTDPAVIPFTRRTGSSGDVHTAQATGTLYEIDNHSFAQTKTGSAEIGIHVNAIDLSTAIPATSVNPLYQFTTTPPAQGETDRRIMPWRDTVVRDIELSFELSVKTMQRANALGYAQSHPVIELIDTKSRRNFYITIAAAAVLPLPTTPETDFYAKDFGVGNAIVSTVFRDNPGFGVRLAGTSFSCSTLNNPNACPAQPTAFRFRLRRQDFAFVIAKARALDPVLSPDIADYASDNFSFNNEVNGDAQVGLTLANYTLTIFDR